MFSKNQIGDIVKQGIQSGAIPSGTKLYMHFVTGQYDDDNTDTYEFSAVYFITTSSVSFADSPFEGQIIACGGTMAGDGNDYNIISYNSADGKLLVQISGTSDTKDDSSEGWTFTEDTIIAL